MARKILLADDSVTAQNMGRKILADAGYEVITVNNGSAALKRIAEAKPDVIVLDVYMPGYSGLEVCQRLKESNDTARIPILLTVGKLEPFKPEEAKRVRAEAFIVKPFEASELLSALTKLEDKIVPRSDSSKPGRFARAIAAVEEGRYDKSVSAEEDSGWKNRISFPRKKKEKEKPVEPEDGNDPAIYNAVNRDLKTVVEHKPEHAPQSGVSANPAPAQQEAHVDLGALVANGLPKDVTPEEIAALAAAAAQVQGIAESTTSQPSSMPAPEPRPEESNKPEVSPSQSEPAASEIKIETAKSEAVASEAIAERTAGMGTEAPQQASPEDTPKSDSQEVAAGAGASPENSSGGLAATFAPEKLEQKEETGKESDRDESVDEDPLSALADSLPPIAGFITGEATRKFGNGDSADAVARTAQPEPVTMAAGATRKSASRWTAVAVALAPEESSVALEEEMRKAQESALAASSPEPTPVTVEDRAIASPAEAATPPVAETSVTQAEPAVGGLAESPTAADEETPVITASTTPVVKEFESVTSRESEASSSAPESPIETASAAGVDAEVSNAPSTVSAISSGNAEATNLPAASIPLESAPETAVASTIEEAAVPERQPVPSEAVAPPDPESSTDQEQPAEVASSTTSFPAEGFERDIPQESNEPAVVGATQEVSGGPVEMVKKETEIAATTAAAWASWRRIRENADGQGAEMNSDKESEPRDQAAMAAAAGAEKAPQDSSDAEVAPEIASIVDSVLADLRPKIVEEISKKLGKKK